MEIPAKSKGVRIARSPVTIPAIPKRAKIAHPMMTLTPVEGDENTPTTVRTTGAAWGGEKTKPAPEDNGPVEGGENRPTDGEGTGATEGGDNGAADGGATLALSRGVTSGFDNGDDRGQRIDDRVVWEPRRPRQEPPPFLSMHVNGQHSRNSERGAVNVSSVSQRPPRTIDGVHGIQQGHPAGIAHDVPDKIPRRRDPAKDARWKGAGAAGSWPWNGGCRRWWRMISPALTA
jgi:hypothetical protein